MQVTISAATVGALIGGLLGIVSTAAAAWTIIVKPLRATLTSIRLLSEDWNGEPSRPGVPGRPGVMVRLEQNDQRLERIEEHLGITDDGAKKTAARSRLGAWRTTTIVTAPDGGRA